MYPIYYRCVLFSKYVLLGADGLNLDMLPTFFFFSALVLQ